MQNGRLMIINDNEYRQKRQKTISGKGLPEVFQNGKHGFLVQTKSPHALAKKINFLLENPKKAKEMGKAGRQHVMKKFTWEKMAQAYEKNLFEIDEWEKKQRK